MTMKKMQNLKYIIENELVICCPFLSTDLFISYCKDLDIQTSRKQLEQFEKLEIFYPIARVQSPKIKTKIEYIDNGKRYRKLGILKDDEEWSGDIKEEYADFRFQKEYAMSWLEEELLWEPASRSFQAWETFKDEQGYRETESFYSIFQCYTLYNLIQFTKIELKAEAWVSHSKEDIKVTSKVLDWAEKVISLHQNNGIRGEAAVATCQVISNRYFPKTQSDRRTFQVSHPSYPSYYGNWDWFEYCRNWNAKAVLNDLGMTIGELEHLHELVAISAKFVDPLERWYGLISFVSVDQKKKLKDKALFAQTLYSMEHMLRLFYEELTGNKLLSPDESPSWKKFSWDDVPGNDSRKLLEYLKIHHDIDWAKSAEISKSDDGKVICIVEDKNSAEIMLDEKKKKATLKISDGRTHDLEVKKENNKQNIYDNFFGGGVTQNELKNLEFLTNQYHLNPRPKLILVVEGNGEAEQFPRLARELFGYSFPQGGIEVVNIQGVGNFTGKKKIDKYGALERFIDDYHHRQTVVFVVLDDEGRVSKIKEELLKAHSKYYPNRMVTKEEYIHVWDNKNIEFDNFSHDEIARAMTKLSEGGYTFKVDEIAHCENCFSAGESNPLGKLFREKLNYGLSKPELLNILFGFIISYPENEFDADDKAKRPVVQVIEKVRELAAKNYPPVTQDIWRKNQESGYFGDPVE
ncbi:MAG: hypothetical protein WBE22_04800 [Halobacteriota archaeon]